MTTTRDISPQPTWNDEKGAKVAVCSCQTLIPPGQARWGRKWPPKIRDGQQFSEEVVALVEAYDQRLGLAGRARADLAHLAFAVAYETDYLVTWNCKHLANGQMDVSITSGQRGIAPFYTDHRDARGALGMA